MSSCLPSCPASDGSEHTTACNEEFAKKLDVIQKESKKGEEFDIQALFNQLYPSHNPRQSGKSNLMKQIEAEMRKQSPEG